MKKQNAGNRGKQALNACFFVPIFSKKDPIGVSETGSKEKTETLWIFSQAAVDWGGGNAV